MPTLKKDLLFDLIQSLTKAEKRNFRIYAKKIQQNGEVLFVQLFNYLEKQTLFDVNVLLKDLPNLKIQQIANLKRNLYQHLLISLRLLYSKKQVALELREFLDYAEILYSKGLYLQALKILARAKKIAIKTHQSILHLEIVAFESKIESHHITRSSTERMSDLMLESQKANEVISNVSKLANLKLYLQRFFINHGHLKTDQLKEKIYQYFQEKISPPPTETATFFEKVCYYQSCYWYHFLLQDFQACYEYSQKWVRLYDDNENMVDKDLDMYLRAVHHLLNTSFFIKNGEELNQRLTKFEGFLQKNLDHFSLNTYVQAHLFLYQSKFNQYFINNDFEKGLQLIPEVLQFIDNYSYQLDNYKIMILHYKIASCYFGVKMPDKTIDYLNKIINYSGRALREDILLYSRLLLILAHYELGNEAALLYLIHATERQLSHIAYPDEVSLAMIAFFKKLNKAIPRTEKALFLDFQQRINQLSTVPEEGRAFIFLDLSKWVAAKLHSENIGHFL